MNKCPYELDTPSSLFRVRIFAHLKLFKRYLKSASALFKLLCSTCRKISKSDTLKLLHLRIEALASVSSQNVSYFPRYTFPHPPLGCISRDTFQGNRFFCITAVCSCSQHTGLYRSVIRTSHWYRGGHELHPF